VRDSYREELDDIPRSRLLRRRGGLRWIRLRGQRPRQRHEKRGGRKRRHFPGPFQNDLPRRLL